MEAHSMDLRERVLAAYDEGMATAGVAKRLSVSRSWARRIKQWRNEGRSIEPKPVGGSEPKLDETARGHLRRFVEETPDATLAEHQDRIARELSIRISVGALWNTLWAMGLPLKKKSLIASEQERPDVKEAREKFFDQIKDVPLEDIVVLDESYATTKFTRLRGRCPPGARLSCRVPHGHWKLLTAIAAMTVRGVLCGVTIDATTTGEVFEIFVREVLAPSLKPGQVVVMDNLAAHKVGLIREAIERVGCRVLYLPPYSPDFSPIEPMWSKVKQILRSIGARTVEAVEAALQTALASITESDCRGYFGHCGYTLHLR